MADKLADKACVPCRKGAAPLQGDEIEELRGDLDPDWRVVDQHHLERKFEFRDFREALEFTNRIGAVAEDQGHHPDIHLGWGKVDLTVFTHKIDGLTESDFIFAAKVDQLRE